MSPEQTQGTPSDAKTDVWSLAVTLQELITAVPVFKGDSLPALFMKIVNADPAPLREQAPDAPEDLEQAVLRALEKDPAERSTLSDFARALAPFAERGADDRVARIEQLAKIKPPLESMSSTPELAAGSSDLPTRESPLQPKGDQARGLPTRVERAPSPAPASTPAPAENATLAPVEPPPYRPKNRQVVALGGLAITLSAVAVLLAVHDAKIGKSESTSATAGLNRTAASDVGATDVGMHDTGTIAPVSSEVAMPVPSASDSAVPKPKVKPTHAQTLRLPPVASRTSATPSADPLVRAAQDMAQQPK